MRRLLSSLHSLAQSINTEHYNPKKPRTPVHQTHLVAWECWLIEKSVSSAFKKSDYEWQTDRHPSFCPLKWRKMSELLAAYSSFPWSPHTFPSHLTICWELMHSCSLTSLEKPPALVDLPSFALMPSFQFFQQIAGDLDDAKQEISKPIDFRFHNALLSVPPYLGFPLSYHINAFPSTLAREPLLLGTRVLCRRWLLTAGALQ